jgi:hypothetical protein
MRTADIPVGDVVHRLHITHGGTRTRVEVGCDHGDAERVLAALSGVELQCDWPAAVLQHVLRRRVPIEEACEWARLPVTPDHPHFMVLWKCAHVRLPWSLVDLERRRKEGRTAQQAAEFCVHYPHRVSYVKWPA